MDRHTEPHWDQAALITIDTQCDFLDGACLEIPGTTAVLPNMARLLEAFRQSGRPVVHIVRLYREDGSNVDICRREAVEQGSGWIAPSGPGCQLAPQLLPRQGQELDCPLLLNGGIQELGPNEAAIYKPRWGAFYHTPLEEHLRRLGVDTLVFCGCNYPNCPRTSMYEASERDFRLVLAWDALSGLYDQGRRELENIGVALLSTGQVLGFLKGL